ncbi:MAG: hypothetical protein ACREUU_00240 [Gammaproteobacteria bacterium]
MNPSEFVELAVKLSANPWEAAQRSAISRAYYGAFHAAKRLIESCGFRFGSTGETHQHLPYCLEHSGDSALAIAGRQLDSLRQTRNIADYDLDAPSTAGRVFVSLQLKAARDVLDAVQSATQRLPAFRQAVRDYAKNVLGKVLQGE